uniref:hypothetical protein n=1 Tax=Haloprofundus sp. MHR1 TaxID=2572921 RepID=UPI001F43EFF5|nr:hypothetical protein [Haloprofundus sp. MHR1]
MAKLKVIDAHGNTSIKYPEFTATAMPLETPRNISDLKEHGPVPDEDLPTEVTPRHREAGLRFFAVRRGQGGTESFGGEVTRIAYLQEHDQEEVLRTFLDENPQLVEAKQRRALTQTIRQQGRSWSQLASNVLGDYYETTDPRGPSWESEETQECPLCGKELNRGGLPAHLTRCPER